MTCLQKKCSLIALSAVLALGIPTLSQGTGGNAEAIVEERMNTSTTSTVSPFVTAQTVFGSARFNHHIPEIFAALKTVRSAENLTDVQKESLRGEAWKALARSSGLEVMEDEKIRLKRGFFTDVAAFYAELISTMDASIARENARIRDLQQAIQARDSSHGLPNQLKTEEIVKGSSETFLKELEFRKNGFAEEANFFAETFAKFGHRETDQFQYRETTNFVETAVNAVAALVRKPYLYATKEGPFLFAVLERYKGEATQLLDLLKADAPKKTVPLTPEKSGNPNTTANSSTASTE